MFYVLIAHLSRRGFIKIAVFALQFADAFVAVGIGLLEIFIVPVDEILFLIFDRRVLVASDLG